MMDIDILIEDVTEDVLELYSWVSIKFEVDAKLEIDWNDKGLGGFVFSEKSIDSYVKDYDSADNNPRHIMHKFDVNNWKVFSACDGDRVVGGAIVAYDTEGIHMLEGRDDLAVLWDIRIEEAYRGKGIGRMLMNAVKRNAKSRGCNRLKVETQNNNVNACKFYVSQGGQLSNMNRYAYKDMPDEIQLIWSIDL